MFGSADRVTGCLPAARSAVRGRSAFFPKSQAALAQLVEHIIRNDGVACSSHASGTTSSAGQFAETDLSVVVVRLAVDVTFFWEGRCGAEPTQFT